MLLANIKDVVHIRDRDRDTEREREREEARLQPAIKQ